MLWPQGRPQMHAAAIFTGWLSCLSTLKAGVPWISLLQCVYLAVLPTETKTQEEESSNPNVELKRWTAEMEALPMLHLTQSQYNSEVFFGSL